MNVVGRDIGSFVREAQNPSRRRSSCRWLLPELGRQFEDEQQVMNRVAGYDVVVVESGLPGPCSRSTRSGSWIAVLINCWCDGGRSVRAVLTGLYRSCPPWSASSSCSAWPCQRLVLISCTFGPAHGRRHGRGQDRVRQPGFARALTACIAISSLIDGVGDGPGLGFSAAAVVVIGDRSRQPA